MSMTTYKGLNHLVDQKLNANFRLLKLEMDNLAFKLKWPDIAVALLVDS